MPDGDPSVLTVIFTVIKTFQDGIGEDFHGPDKIHTVFLKVAFALVLIPFKQHIKIVCTSVHIINGNVKFVLIVPWFVMVKE